MKDLQIKGKYTVKGEKQQIVANNNLTVYGAIQMARVLKKDVVFPKNDSNSFGRIISYNGQLKRIRIKQGSQFNFPTESQLLNSAMSYHSISNQGQELSKQYAIDQNQSSSVTVRFSQNANAACYFDVKLKQQVNIGRIGILAKYNGGYQNQLQNYNKYYVFDLSFYLRPAGFNLSYVNPDGITDQNDIQQIANCKGDYIKVYNINKPTINGKPYYIKTKPINGTETLYHCLYFNGISWVIGTSNFIKNDVNDINIVDNVLCPQTPNSYIISFDKSQLLDTNEVNIYRTINNSGIQRQITYKIHLTRGVNKWIKPSNRMHNYATTFYNSSFSEIKKQDRYMTLLSDTNSKYNRGNGTTSYINYDCYSTNFDSMLSYNCFSFEDLQQFTQLYNVLNQRYSVDECNENLSGFSPYIDAIRFFRTKHNESNMDTTLTIYSIDIFQPCKTPYNPCKIALSEDGIFRDENSWFVDSIQMKGDNIVVFSKQLQYNQAITNGLGFKYIGLFGNTNGHLNGTIPCQFKILNKNCFSKAQFQTPWQKTNQQQIIITYQISIGDAE